MSYDHRHLLLLSLKRFDEACSHLHRARKLFELLHDSVRCAQVDETLAQLYIASDRYDLAERAINLSIDTLEISGEDAFLVEALTTRAGIVLCRFRKKKRS